MRRQRHRQANGQAAPDRSLLEPHVQGRPARGAETASAIRAGELPLWRVLLLLPATRELATKLPRSSPPMLVSTAADSLSTRQTRELFPRNLLADAGRARPGLVVSRPL